jgi:ABC-2 type transport system permease protein
MYSANSINLTITVCNLDSGSYSDLLITGLSNNFDTSIVSEQNISECVNIIESDLMQGRMLGIIVQESFSDDITNYNQPTLHLYYDNSKPNLGFFAQSYLMNQIGSFNEEVLREAEELIYDNTLSIENDLSSSLDLLNFMNYSIPEVLQESYNELYYSVQDYYEKISELNNIDLEFLVNPVNTELIGVFQGDNSDGFSFCVLYLVLNIIVILLLSSVSIVSDKKSRFLTRLKTSTTPIVFYIISKLIFFSLIGLIIFIPSFVVFSFNNAYFNINWFTLSAAVFIISMISTLIGCIIGLSSKNESSSIMVSIFISFMFLLLSGLFYPVELLPSIVRALLVILPTSFEINLLNNALIFNTELGMVVQTIYFLLGYFIVFSIITYYLIHRD